MGQQIPVDLAQAFTEAKPLIIILEVQSADSHQPVYGSGILVGYDASFLYGVSASHVLWRGSQPANSSRAYLVQSDGRTITISAEPLITRDPMFTRISVLAVTDLTC